MTNRNADIHIIIYTDTRDERTTATGLMDMIGIPRVERTYYAKGVYGESQYRVYATPHQARKLALRCRLAGLTCMVD